MKKGPNLLAMIVVLSIGIIVGVFIGRNIKDDSISLTASSASQIPESTAEPTDSRIDINSATVSQMMILPGIGETLASRIVDYRQNHGAFSTTDELLNIEGIGQKTLDQINHLIKAGG